MELTTQPVAPVEALKSTQSQVVTEKLNSDEGQVDSKPAGDGGVLPKADEEVSPKFAALANREKRLQQKVQAERARIQQEQAELLKLKEEIERKTKDVDGFYSEGKKDPIAALKRLGYSYEDVTNFVLNDNKKPADLMVNDVRSEVEALRKELADKETRTRQAYEAQAKAQEAEQIADYKQKLGEYIKGNVDTYEYINTVDQESAVQTIYEIVAKHWEENGVAMKAAEACQKLEAYLEEQAEKLIKTKKYQSKYGSAQQPSKSEPKSSMTLNNQTTGSAPSLVSPKTEMDRMQRALAALNQTQ